MVGELLGNVDSGCRGIYSPTTRKPVSRAFMPLASNLKTCLSSLQPFQAWAAGCDSGVLDPGLFADLRGHGSHVAPVFALSIEPDGKESTARDSGRSHRVTLFACRADLTG